MYEENYPEPSLATTAVAPHWWQPKHLSEVHRYAIREWARGVSIAHITANIRRMGHRSPTPLHLRRVMKTEAGQQYLSFCSAQIAKRLDGLIEHGQQFVPDAAVAELNMLNNPLTPERHRLSAAQDWMDRFGPPKISRQEAENKIPQTVIINLLPSQLAQFTAPPPVIEAEVVPLLANPSSNDD